MSHIYPEQPLDGGNPSKVEEPTRQVLAETSRRAITFLTAVAAHESIYDVLLPAGYTHEVHAQGWALLAKVAELPRASAMNVRSASRAIKAAQKEIERWHIHAFARARAALRHLHPNEEAFVFGGLEVSRDQCLAVTVVNEFLKRCDALAAPNNEAGHAALATLEARNLGATERERVRGLVDLVLTGIGPWVMSPTSTRAANVRALYDWVTDWRETARVVVKRRVDLIHLGISRRRSRTTNREQSEDLSLIKNTSTVHV